MAPNQRFTSSARNLLVTLDPWGKCRRLQEDFNNINRMKPIRLNVAGSSKPPRQSQPKLTPNAIASNFISVPTEAEMGWCRRQ